MTDQSRIDSPHRIRVSCPISPAGPVRIDTGNKDVVKVDLGDGALVGGDGLLLDGNTLYVVLNRFARIVAVELSDDMASGEVGEGITDESFRFPTTIARAGDTFLVVISQIDQREGTPDLPFTVARFPIAD
jgi:hypothetical protein